MTNDKMLTIAEVARQLQVSGHMIKAMIDAEEIHAFRPHPKATRKRIWSSEVERYRLSKSFSEKECG